MSWVNRAEKERLAKQRQGEDTQYTHHWTVKDLRYAQTSTIAKDVQALANMLGHKLHPGGRTSSRTRIIANRNTLRRSGVALTTSATRPHGAMTMKPATGRATPS